MDLDQLLNENQKKAATYLDSHLRIIAGAGSGKTRVVTYRIAYLIETIGVDPRKILAITFTNKAANEMKERVNDILGILGAGSTICTIHSLCVRILRQHINVLNYPRNFIIMDEEDQKSVIKKIYKELDIDAKTISIKSMLHTISNYKMANMSPDQVIEYAGEFQGELKKAKVYQSYVRYQEEHFMLDFDDLIIKTVYLLENYEEVLERWQHKFDYIHVDEFQDVDEKEYRLIKLLSGHAIVCVVGDPDQTIYSFRGADVTYILDFDKDFRPSKTIILDRNYRSSGNILHISNQLIKKNRNRLEKNLYTESSNGANVIHYLGKSEVAEANFICDKIEEIINNVEGVNYHNFAILYRANYLSRTIEQALISRSIDYRIFGGLKFFNRKEVKDALSYLRLIENGDDLSFERIINVPSRGIGAKTLDNIRLVSLRYGISLYDALSLHSNEIRLSAKAKKECQNLVQAIEKAKMSDLPIHEMFETLMEETGYLEMLRKDLETNRIDNLHELQRSIYDYEASNPDTATIGNYLQDISLYTDNDQIDHDEYISLMSIHMAKGLEFDYVFVLGLSEGIFPSIRTMAESADDGLEEERRLAYVAFTRAKKQLFLTNSEGYNFVTGSPKIGSRFIDEVGLKGIQHIGTTPRYKTIDYISSGPTKEELIGDNQIKDWQNGDLVIHDAFGKGVVIKVHDTTLDIAFEMPIGIKTLVSSHKALKKLIN